jgi:hypothetical protein
LTFASRKNLLIDWHFNVLRLGQPRAEPRATRRDVGCYEIWADCLDGNGRFQEFDQAKQVARPNSNGQKAGCPRAACSSQFRAGERSPVGIGGFDRHSGMLSRDRRIVSAGTLPDY